MKKSGKTLFVSMAIAPSTCKPYVKWKNGIWPCLRFDNFDLKKTPKEVMEKIYKLIEVVKNDKKS